MQIARESTDTVKATIAKELPYLIVIEEHEVSLLEGDTILCRKPIFHFMFHDFLFSVLFETPTEC